MIVKRKNVIKRKKRSLIWKLPYDEFKELVKKSTSIGQILRYFNLENKGGNHKTVKNRCIDEKIDFSHIKLGINSNKGRKFVTEKTPIENILVEKSTFNRSHLKERILSEKIMEYKCSVCGNSGYWNNNKLVLQLEHKNGIHNDNRLENLCFLCPNCHSQTKTYCGRNITK